MAKNLKIDVNNLEIKGKKKDYISTNTKVVILLLIYIFIFLAIFSYKQTLISINFSLIYQPINNILKNIYLDLV